MPKPICFMVMPFRTKDTNAKPLAPPKVNFDVLWERAFCPAIKDDLGYEPVRADQEVGGLIIHEMLERLYFSDLVIADLSIPNANVYYEVGVRHAAQKSGCVLIGADWAKPLFDLDQVRQARYPLPEEEITAATATAIRQILRDAIPKLATGETPVFQTLPGYPAAVNPDRATSIRNFLHEMSAFQAEVGAARAAPSAERTPRALALRDKYPASKTKIQTLGLEIMSLLRDCAGWQEALAYIDGLPEAVRKLPIVCEQRCLAQSKTGNHLEAIAALQELIKLNGATSEREGLIGGRYKQLSTEATDAIDKARFLNEAITHYENGMALDLNDCYPSCNLPRLYRARAKRGDADRARSAAAVARMACERAVARNPNDEWARPTMIGLAFDAGDVTAAEELEAEIRLEGAAKWKLISTLADLELSVSQAQDATVRAGLEAVLAKLKALT